MIDNLSTAAALYLAPFLSLTAFLLTLFVFLSPTVMLHSQVALLTISPSSSLTSPHQSTASSIDGATLSLGLLGSCGKPSHASSVNCTVTSFSPVYDTSILPSSSDPDILGALPSTAPAAVVFSLILSTCFVILFSLITYRSRLGKFGAALDRPVVSRASVWLGLLGFMVGMTAYLVLRLWFGKMADDFNQGIVKQGSKGPQLIATVGNAFTMIWVAYAFNAVPLVCAMTKLHVTAAGDKF